ncbi:very short patch repair endonuclease [Mycolicibacterium sp. HK-90]|uniref:very short patch repair endonuclease n=1 Tax=Mycolicibacterium sp. HK-90 TaxID=3056937 RepID=UPI0026585CDB|nr:very short patch repair endonuclease [Mycolicibacterium sp. HK-90]WKG01388.1 very short patch repair endonuclease [Mycolicibacterium sp. HK-90]
MPSESWASSDAVRNVMRANRGRDTGPEMALRRALHAAGLRYRVNARPIPDSRMTVDVVFPRARVAVEVLGCFWHGCPEHHRPSQRNAEFWSSKIAGTVERDQRKRAALEADGWAVVTVWEHDDITEAAERVTATVRARQAESRRPT